MTKLILIRTAQTDWQAQGRLAGDTDLELNEIGHRQAAADAQAVAGFAPQSIHCGADQATQQTATIIADELRLKVKTLDALREIDLGHWEGLTIQGFRDRFSKVYRQWRSNPLSVEPPEGESVSAIAARLEKGIVKILKRKNESPLILVLGRFAYATTRCSLDDGDFEHFWKYIDDESQWHALDFDPTRNADGAKVKKDATTGS